jgi:8-oxo-dGTP pyrophosphatase MutT (NUDIX family)
LFEETGMIVDKARALFELSDSVEFGGKGRPLSIFHVVYDGSADDLTLGEGRELRFFPTTALPERVPPHVAESIARFVRLRDQ